MDYSALRCPFEHPVITHIYLVQTVEQLRWSCITQIHSAHPDVVSAENVALNHANVHKDFPGARQELIWTFPGYQKCWRTTYKDNLWVEVKIRRVPLAAESPRLSLIEMPEPDVLVANEPGPEPAPTDREARAMRRARTRRRSDVS